MSEAPTLSIRKFNVKEMDINSKVLITAKPGKQRYVTLPDLLYRYRNSEYHKGRILAMIHFHK